MKNIFPIKSQLFMLVTAMLLFNYSCRKPDRINKITTDKVEVNGTSVIAHGQLLDISETGIISYGFCWDTLPEPTLNSAVYYMPQTAQRGAFNATIDNLEPYKTYYIRAFLSGQNETIYGNTLATTLISLDNIVVTTSQAQATSITSATVNGSIAGLGSMKISDYGHCWATTSNPTVNNFNTALGNLNNDTSFTSTLTGLDLSTTYYVRTYAKINNNTLIYGNETTVVLPELTVVTDTFQFPNATDVTLSGNIIQLGINPVTNHGLCWSFTLAQPTINDNIISLGTTQNTGLFSGTMPVLSGVIYYYRAFATDGAYVKYGAVKQFVKN